jgi:hypothetical protein
MSLLSDQLRQGLNPRDLALSFALGATLGIMPLIWGTSLVCIGCAFCFRLNQAVVQLANYMMYPLQIVLFIPWLLLGEQLFASDLLPKDSAQLLEQLTQSPLLFFSHFQQSNIQGLLVWFVLSPLFFVFVFKITHLMAKRAGCLSVLLSNRRRRDNRG